MAVSKMQRAGLLGAPLAVPNLEKIVALYVRVSTGRQVDKDSIPFQIKECKYYIEHFLKLKNIEIFEDAGKSGKNTDRPGYQRMMKKVRAGLVSHVVVYKIDRISRNLVDFSVMYDDFKAERVTFVSLNEQFDTSSAIGEAVLKIILIFAELERKLTSERVMDIMISRALDHKWNGARVPFGWDWDAEAGFPKHSDAEAVFARLMYDMYEETRSSCKVRDYNNTHDIPTKRGGEWTSKTVADFIRNPMNRGDYRYNYRESARGKKKPHEEVIYIENVFPPLVDPDQWDRCNAIMNQNAAARGNVGRKVQRQYDHIFGGVLVCGLCGSFFHSDKDKRRDNGFFPSQYRCGSRTRKRNCLAPGVSDVKIGPFVFNYISNMVRASKLRSKINSPAELEEVLTAGPEFASVAGLVASGLNETYSAIMAGTAAGGPSYLPVTIKGTGEGVDVSEFDTIKQEKAKIDRALERLNKLYLFDDNGISEKEYLTMKRDLESKMVDLNNRAAALEEITFETSAGEMAFVTSASSFLLAHEIQSGDHIVYSDFAATIEDKVLKDFISLVINKIVILDGRISSIEFKNGLIHEFLYKE